MSSRRYIKRVYRVPQDRGPGEYMAALVVKMLVKHGWPASSVQLVHVAGFQVLHKFTGFEAEQDFWAAVSIAVRIVARTYRVEVQEHLGTVRFLKNYRVAAGGHFREI